MPRRFKETADPQKARTDWKREQASARPPASARRRAGIQSLMQRRMPSGGPGGGGPGGGLDAMRNHPAVRFGQQMTGGVGDGPRQAIMNQVMQRLAQRGISQDPTGTWQIAGLNRPHDPGIDIRNSAIAAMDPSGEMLRRVLGAGGVPGSASSSAMPGSIRGMPSGMGGVPSPGLGAGSLPISPQNGMPLPPVRPPMPNMPNMPGMPPMPGGMPRPGGMESVPPGLPGGPPMPGSQKLPPITPGGPPPSSPPFPPQGQGVGRTTTPTGAEIDPTKYPTTGGGMAPGSVPGAQTGAEGRARPTTPGLGAGSPAGFPVIGPMGTAKPPPTSLGLPPAGTAGGLNQAAPNGGYAHPGSNLMQPPPPQPGLGGLAPMPRTEYGTPMQPSSPSGAGAYDQGVANLAKQFPSSGMPSGGMPPPSVANDIYRQPGTPVNTAPGNEAPGGWGRVGQTQPPVAPPTPLNLPPPPPGSTMQTFANPGSALTQRLQQGRPGTPPAPGRAPTPMVAPGAMPGQSTPFNPAQMAQPVTQLPPIPRPTGFGTPGQTQIPGQRQAPNLAGLGQSIQATVQQRIGASAVGQRPGVSPATPGSPVGNSLENLGDRIRAAVSGNRGDVQPSAPGGGTNLGPATTSIMDRVRQQLSQAGVGQPRPPMTNGTTPFPQPGGQSTTTMPGGAPSTGTMPTAPGGAPVPPGGAPSNVPAGPAPGTTAGGLGSYGNQSIDQWDSAFIAAGQKYGVDPASLKAIMDVETGGDGNYPITKCRGDDGTGVASCGPMQIKGEFHGGQAATVEDQIMQAARILADYKAANPGATDRDALFAVYFTGDDPNGTSQSDYAVRFDQLVGQIGSSAPAPGGTTPAVDPTTGAPMPDPNTAAAITNAGMGGVVPPPDVTGAPSTGSSTPGANVIYNPEITGSIGVLDAPSGGIMAAPGTDTGYVADMVGGSGVITSAYKVPYEGQGSLYCYQEGRQASCDAQAAIDIGCTSPNPETGSCYGAPVSMVGQQGGTVVCSGTGNGSGAYDSCNDYGDEWGGSGNITIMLDPTPMGDQIQIRYGHMAGNAVGEVGSRVEPGQAVGTMGFAGTGPHVHFEAMANCNGQLIYLDPTLVIDGYYQNHSVC